MSDVSIVLPCFGQDKYVEDSITSVRTQTHKAWRCAIVYESSLDQRILTIATQGDARFELIPCPATSLPAARNMGLRRSSGRYVLALDADDIIGPCYLSEATEILDCLSEVRIAYSEAELFGDLSGPMVVSGYSRDDLKKRNMIYSAAVFRREDFETVGGYDENMTKGLEDWEIWVAILKREGIAFRIPAVHFFYRKHRESLLANMSSADWAEAKAYVKIKHSDFVV